MSYTIGNQIADQPFDSLQLKKIVESSAFEILSISLEKGALFPEHTSPRDAKLIVLEGDIVFEIDGASYNLKTQQNLNFPKSIPHSVMANENSKFLIIR